MIRDLGSAVASDIDGHYQALLRYARQYLESCRTCNLRCEPRLAGCGYITEASGYIRSVEHPSQRFQVSEETDFSAPQIAFVRQGVTYKPSAKWAAKYFIEGEPPPELAAGHGGTLDAEYGQFVDGAEVLPENLRRSYSGLCLSGRVMGAVATREGLASIRFRSESREYTLPNLLAVRGWCAAQSVSRCVLFNARTARADGHTFEPALTVADGDASFLEAIDRPEFQRSDVIGVIPRTIDRDRLEGVGNRMQEMRKWYDEDPELTRRFAPVARAIGVSVLTRRIHR